MDVDGMKELLAKAQSERRWLRERLNECSYTETWLRRVIAEFDREQVNFERYRSQPVKQTLIDLSGLNGGLVEIQWAVDVLLQAGVFDVREQASAAVRSAFYANKDIFENIDRGRYRLIEQVPAVSKGLSAPPARDLVALFNEATGGTSPDDLPF